MNTAIKTPSSTCSIDSEGYLRVEFNEGVYVTLSEAIEVTDACIKVIGNRSRLAIVDFRKAKGIKLEALRYFYQDSVHLSTYRAVVTLTRTMPGLWAGYLVSSLYRPQLPFFFAKDLNKAKNWLSANDPKLFTFEWA